MNLHQANDQFNPPKIAERKSVSSNYKSPYEETEAVIKQL